MASAESVSHSSHGLKQSPTASKTDTRKAYSCPVCGTVHLIERQSGMTCEHCQADLSPTGLTSFPAASRARTLALQDVAWAWKATEAVCFLKSSDYAAIYDRDSFSWKTSQLSLFEDLSGFVWNSLQSGMIVDGRLYQPQNLAPRTSESDGSYLPTPTAADFGTGGNGVKKGKQKPVISLGTMARKNLWPTPKANDAEKRGNFDVNNPRNGLPAAVKRSLWPTPTASEGAKGGPGRRYGNEDMTLSAAVSSLDEIGGQLSPIFVEWLMGFPLEWTALDALETQLFRSKRAKPSNASSESEASA